MLLSSRFDTLTWEENQRFREKNKIPCIYGSPLKISQKIQVDEDVFIIEMNNSLNQIEGIGLIKNTLRLDKYIKLYDTYNFNRYVYKGNHHINREKLLKENNELVYILDNILFKGKTHLKRGSGITCIPDKLLRHTICNEMDIKYEIKKLFTVLFNYKFNQ